MRRVVISGMGIWSCIGTTPAQVRDALDQGKSGIGIDFRVFLLYIYGERIMSVLC